jgi:hypothetical protein
VVSGRQILAIASHPALCCGSEDLDFRKIAAITLSALPVPGFRDRPTGILAGLSMFLLGLLLEVAQHYSPGSAVEFGDVIANGAGVTCGVLLARPVSALRPPPRAL